MAKGGYKNFYAGKYLNNYGSPKVGGPPRLSGAGAVGECGGDDDTYYKKKYRWSSGPVQLDHPGWRRKVAQSHLQAISGRRPLDHPPWSSVVQGGPGWSRVVQSGSSRVGPPCGQTERCAQQGRQRDRTAASSNGPQRHAAPIAAGPQGRRGASPGWRAVDQAGPPTLSVKSI